MSFKKSVTTIAFCSIFSAGLATANERITIGTGGTGGLFYVIGAGIAETLNNHMEGATARAEVTGASVENNRRVAAGQMTMGLSSSSTLYEALNGDGPFGGRPQAVSAIAYLYPAVLQIATIEDTEVENIGDLAGKRVSLGPPGSNAAVLAQRVLEAYGVFDAIQPQFLSYNEGVGALMNNQLDATVVLAGAPTAALIDLDAQRDMRLLPVSEEQLGDMLEAYPFYQLFEIPPGTYSDQTEGVMVINDPAILFTSADAPEETIYAITETLFSHLDELGEVHPQAKAISLENAPDTPIELHPGAARYFAEASE
ncbi:TAXI family TRAP transporter solute-binding subunit [Billgrantia aerodenitrificans]|uniref:TAXI family TRAP transporter solute-binding subunit n=1 Tax=Billgrantia aerodenitrificans TaxID=2733483 RepID=A0ABS9ANA6_9GAMM|nr:TAXI family TRAP transporter solute-binding subunit [Halomonas aerodenitrificans]MCE8023219.1 TAXI family TRAP transporter solute-binding subunit [Halomonas aerodenitrificans]